MVWLRTEMNESISEIPGEVTPRRPTMFCPPQENHTVYNYVAERKLAQKLNIQRCMSVLN